MNTSPMFLEVIVLYVWYDFRGIQSPCLCRDCQPPMFSYTRADRAEEASRHHRQYKVFSEAQKVRDFRLVLCAEVWDDVGEYSVGVLKELWREKRQKVLDGFSSEPTVVRRYRNFFFPIDCSPLGRIICWCCNSIVFNKGMHLTWVTVVKPIPRSGIPSTIPASTWPPEPL